MHQVLVRNLDNHNIHAEAAMTGGDSSDFLLSGLRLYRNFAVLVAAGHIQFPREAAQALVTANAADMREVFPDYYRAMDRNSHIIPLDEAMDDPEEDFSDTLLCYLNGAAVIRVLDDPDDGADEDDTMSTQDDEDDDSGETCGSASPGCAPPRIFGEPSEMAGKTAEQVEAALNRNYITNTGEVPSPARQDYHRLSAKALCGVAWTQEEFDGYADLHNMIGQQSACRIAQAKTAERAAACEESWQAQCGEQAEIADAPLFEQYAREVALSLIVSAMLEPFA